MTQEEWATELAQAIAGEVRRHRLARKMSAQQLADRCAALGMEIPRSVLANLENGRRPTVSVAELLILAAALEVPPVTLIAPLGQAPETQILPNRELTTWDAVLWMSGETRLPDDATDKETEWISDTDIDSPIPLYHEHDGLVSQLKATDRFFGDDLVLETTDGRVLERASYRNRAEVELQDLRALMRQRGLLPPPLPPELADIDTEKRAPIRTPRRTPGKAD